MGIPLQLGGLAHRARGAVVFGLTSRSVGARTLLFERALTRIHDFTPLLPAEAGRGAHTLTRYTSAARGDLTLALERGGTGRFLMPEARYAAEEAAAHLSLIRATTFGPSAHGARRLLGEAQYVESPWAASLLIDHAIRDLAAAGGARVPRYASATSEARAARALLQFEDAMPRQAVEHLAAARTALRPAR